MLHFVFAGKRWVGERLDIYLLLLFAGWTGWSDPVWLMPVRVTPSDGFFFSRLLRVRFKSMDQSCRHTDILVISLSWASQWVFTDGGVAGMCTAISVHFSTVKNMPQDLGWDTTSTFWIHTCRCVYGTGWAIRHIHVHYSSPDERYSMREMPLHQKITRKSWESS